MTQLEKIAKLIGLEISQFNPPAMKHLGATVDDPKGEKLFFNPLIDKSDLMDVENSLHSIVVNILPSRIEFWAVHGQYHAESVVYFDDHPDKFTARAHAVCAVAEMIYDKRTEG